MNEKMEKMKLIQELGFVLTELGLYLNSHPDSSEALARFESTRGVYVNAKNEYENLYGPLTYDGVNTVRDGWSWINSPWPWEGAC